MYTKEQLVEFAKKHWDNISDIEQDYSSAESLVDHLLEDEDGDDLAVMDQLEACAFWNDEGRAAKEELLLHSED